MLIGLSFVAKPSFAETDLFALSKALLIGTNDERREVADILIKRGGTDMVPSLVLLMRIGGSHIITQQVLHELTGEEIKTWRDAMVYQEKKTQLKPHPSYYELKLWYWGGIDDRFRSLFDTPIDPAELRIRFEEITWGGVQYDEIPPLDHPSMLSADEADYLLDTDLVFGVKINSDVRAYPLRILGWHEMLNDVIGGEPVALAYCTLCGSGILYETNVPGHKEPFIFGSSGLLYRSNKLMFDRRTNSLWNQFTGEPVSGLLAHSGIRLNIKPLVVASWANWKQQHPDTKVLSLETGHIRNYDSGIAYKEYFASPDLMFPAVTDESRLLQKSRVFGMRLPGGAKAWPLSVFEKESVINDRVGFTNVVLIGDARTRTVRAYDRGQDTYSLDGQKLNGPGGQWQIEESVLTGPAGERRARLPGHVAYWFAWDSYLGPASELYKSDK